jgi:hypothetical protein
MRIAILALFLYAGSAAFGQLGPVGPLIPNHSGSLPSPWTAQGRDFGKLPPGWPATLNMPSWIVINPPPVTLKPLGDAQIDPKIILHPQHSRVGVQPLGTQIAQNQFPGLELLPIQWPKLKIEPIPTVWPNLNMEPISTMCAECRMGGMTPARAGAPAAVTPPSK